MKFKIGDKVRIKLKIPHWECILSCGIDRCIFHGQIGVIEAFDTTHGGEVIVGGMKEEDGYKQCAGFLLSDIEPEKITNWREMVS